MHSPNTLPAKCVINVSFPVADFQPSRCVETYSRAVFHTSDRNGVDQLSHSAMITQFQTKLNYELCNIYLMHTKVCFKQFKAHFSTHLIG